jgi:DNA polymerase III delta prime subunit
VRGKLLILGTGGAGKTTTMLELAQELVERAETDINQPMPALFNLSTWKNDKQSMADWLVEQAKSKYGVRKDIVRQWLANKEILPMLDGLDELDLERQESCVEAINIWLDGEYSPPALVVCSRIEEYEKYESQLSLNGAVRLLPLSDQQIRDYLRQFDRANLWEVIANDAPWLSLVRVPLWLSITIVAGVSAPKMQQLTSAEERLAYLLDEYAIKMLNRKVKSQAYDEEKDAPKSRQVKFWLIWLAQQMERESQTELFVDNMQPDLLQGERQKRMYFTSIFIITGMLAGIAGLMFGLLLGDIFLGLLWSIVGFPIGGLVCTIVTMKVRVRIHPSATIKYSMKAFLYRLRLAMTSTILISVIGLLAFEMSVGFFYGINIANRLGEILIDSLRYGLLYGILLGTALVMINKVIITAPDIEKRTSSSQNIMKSFQEVGIFGTSLTFVGLLVGWLNNLPISGIIASGIIGGIFGGLAGGGGASIQHFSLRLVLYFTGKTPWNYSRFLDYATERRLLQRVAGGYRFLHKYLQEHFAYKLPK